nr:uncharacterized protein LOC129384517 [Dermacentor andersoni]
MTKRPPLFAIQVLLPLLAHGIYSICNPARDRAPSHQVTQFSSCQLPPFVHQAAPSRFVNSPFHSRAAAWSSTASSTPVFKRRYPWDRFSGHVSSVAATMTKRPPLFAIQVFPLGTTETASATNEAVCRVGSGHSNGVCVQGLLHQVGANSWTPYPSSSSSSLYIRNSLVWDSFSGHTGWQPNNITMNPFLLFTQLMPSGGDTYGNYCCLHGPTTVDQRTKIPEGAFI